MKKERYITFCSMMIISAMFAICIYYFDSEHSRQEKILNKKEIYINEVCGSYFPTSFVETQPDSDWIELYNASDKSVNLGTFYLSDEKENLYKSKLPSVELMPGEYYVIHSQSDENEDGIERLNFRISTQGEVIYLSDSNGVIDIANVPALKTNTSWSRIKDGERDWSCMEMTYNTSNDYALPVLEKIKEPIFSAESGFYEDEFELKLEAEQGSVIYYTLDGSDPDNKGILYETPILIKDVSNQSNIYSSREDFNLRSEGQINEPVEKITIVRAMAIDEKGRKSDIATRSYLIGKEDKKSYKEMYTVSLVTDPDNLFDYDEGIYILGKKFDEYIANGGNIDDWMAVDANYRIDGKKSERPASIEIFNESGDRVLKRNVGIRIHGATTRGCAQKSFSVYARTLYDGKETIEGLFDEKESVHKFFLYTNREGTKLRDAFISEKLADRDVATQKLRYCNVFLNGEYWGIYLLAEVYDEYFFENHYQIDRNNIQIWEGTSPPEVVEYLTSVSDLSDSEVYEELKRMIDVQSFIDYYASNLYLNNTDWLSHNGICYRSTEVGSGENEDGKWRWGIWDSEAAMYDFETDTFCTGNVMTWEEDVLAQALMEHSEFRKQFVNTYMDLYNNAWQEERALITLSELKNSIKESYAMHGERFLGGNDTTEYYNKIVSFFQKRGEYALEDIKEEFKLKSDLAWLVILSNKENASTFRVNTSVINMPDTWWQGQYFQEYPVQIKIEEICGNNEFLGWYTEEGELLSEDVEITIKLNKGTNIICPRFAE